MIEIIPRHVEGDLPEHEWLSTFSRHVHSMILARDGEKISRDQVGTVVALPSWKMVKAEQWVGNKGDNNLIPARIVWKKDGVETEHLQVIRPGIPVEFEWEINSLGVKGSGKTLVKVDDKYASSGGDSIPQMVAVPDHSQTVETDIDEVVERGRLAKWELSVLLEPTVMKSLRDISHSLSNELLDHHISTIPTAGTPYNEQVVDHVELEGLRDALMYEASAKTGKSPMSRLLEQSLEAKTFTKVEPLRYMATNIRREAWYLARKAIGDPYGSGVNIRRTWNKNQSHLLEVGRERGHEAAMEELVDLYHRTYSRRISVDTAKRALAVNRSPQARIRQVSDEEYHHIVDADPEDEVIKGGLPKEVVDKAYEHSITLGCWADTRMPRTKDTMRMWGKALGLSSREVKELDRLLSQILQGKNV